MKIKIWIEKEKNGVWACIEIDGQKYNLFGLLQGGEIYRCSNLPEELELDDGGKIIIKEIEK